jgi:hypothetical protein
MGRHAELVEDDIAARQDTIDRDLVSSSPTLLARA